MAHLPEAGDGSLSADAVRAAPNHRMRKSRTREWCSPAASLSFGAPPPERGATERAAQLSARALEDVLLGRAQPFAGPVEIKVEHGHCGLKRRCFPTLAPKRRALQRCRHRGGTAKREHARFEVVSVTACDHLFALDVRRRAADVRCPLLRWRVGTWFLRWFVMSSPSLDSWSCAAIVPAVGPDPLLRPKGRGTGSSSSAGGATFYRAILARRQGAKTQTGVLNDGISLARLEW